MNSAHLNTATDPFCINDKEKQWDERGRWPVSWISCPEANNLPLFMAYKVDFELSVPEKAEIYVTADEEYELYLDGKQIGCGSEMGDLNNWFYESYELNLSVGPHTLCALVLSLGEKRAYSRISLNHGFLLAATSDKLLPAIGTGLADWQYKKLANYEINPPPIDDVTGAGVIIDYSKGSQDFISGKGDGWQKALIQEPGLSKEGANEFANSRLLVPSIIPAKLKKDLGYSLRFASENIREDNFVATSDNSTLLSEQWQEFATGKALSIPENSTRRYILETEDYTIARPSLNVSGGGGAEINLRWAESLFVNPDNQAYEKGNRNIVEARYFFGYGDRFLTSGRQNEKIRGLKDYCGRYIELTIKTGNEPLTVNSLVITENLYPLRLSGNFECEDEALQKAFPIMFRGLQMSAFDRFVDCPYYERLMYAGDTRLEDLCTYACTDDKYLGYKSLRMFAASLSANSGLTASRYPSRVRQEIPPFSLIFVEMVGDFALWRRDEKFIKSLLPVVRTVLETFRSWRNEDNLVVLPKGWAFVDWAENEKWIRGVPPAGEFGANSIINWQFVNALKAGAFLEKHFGAPESAAYYQRLAKETAEAIDAAFWTEERAAFADDKDRTSFSEHAQVLAVISGEVSAKKIEQIKSTLVNDETLTRTTVYFSHYLFEAAHRLKTPELLFRRLDYWKNLAAHGFKTVPERPEPSRSDCHGWGSHPLYHARTTICGIRPAAPGFSKIEIAPCPDELKNISVEMPHPDGTIFCSLEFSSSGLKSEVNLPAGLEGFFRYAEKEIPLCGGKQKIEIALDN